MAATVTNTQIDTACSAVASPYGPLTRVTDVANLPTPNSEIELQLTAATGKTYYMTYEQLTDADIRTRIIAYYEGVNYTMRTLKTAINALNTAVNGYAGTPYTYQQYQDTIDALRAITEIKGYY